MALEFFWNYSLFDSSDAAQSNVSSQNFTQTLTKFDGHLFFRYNVTHCLGKFIMSNILGDIGLNGNKLKLIIGTHGH